MPLAMPAPFHFVMRFTGLHAGNDTAFPEVSGIGNDSETTAVASGGETRFVHRLPVAAKQQPLTMKRGTAERTSPLVIWCQATLEGGFARPIEVRDLSVYLLDAQGNAFVGWSVSNAFPTSWRIDPFQTENDSVAIEKIVFGHAAMTRVL